MEGMQEGNSNGSRYLCLVQKHLQSGAESSPSPTFKHLVVYHSNHLSVRIRQAHYEERAMFSMQRKRQHIHARRAMKDKFK